MAEKNAHKGRTLLWTWGGTFFGYRDGDDLWTHDGRHVGRFHEDEVYGPDGHYLGKIRDEKRLITNLGKTQRRKGSFLRRVNRVGIVPRVDYVGRVMYVGHEDFPRPEDI